MAVPHPDCQAVLKQVRQFLDNELDSADADAIRRHLDACEPCLDEAEVESAIRTLVKRCCAEDKAPIDLRSRLQANLETWAQ